MSLASYDIYGTFQSSVVVPSAEAKSRDEQKKLFKPGLHGCPCCQAHELRRMGDMYGEIAGWLLDASLRTSLCSEKNEQVTDALYRAGLLSDKKLRQDLEVLFQSESKPYGPRNIIKRASYRHRQGQGKCSADDEHDIVLSLIRLYLERDISATLPGCRIEWLENKRLDPSRRRPDLQARILVDKQVLDHLAIEVQKSSITLENFQIRHSVLSEFATRAIWLFKENGINGRFKPCVEWALSKQVSIGSYGIDESSNLIVRQILGIDAGPSGKGSRFDNQEPHCNRAEYLADKVNREPIRSPITLRSQVVGDLSFLRPSVPVTELLPPPHSVIDDPDAVEVLYVQSPLTGMDSWFGIRPWHHH
ncbi:hypothetical protein [Leptothoe sp. PORK10 BA2]|uniref:hypothetical protein n=1 Tax=Leptothoe sp. PORK10 BA2 TaxID=3110254 RepID=UPI002B1F82BA|nr:hypothetical protein [Leptothoe sp. PORK10 BA2]MEA5464510.1 hypothetical protein [Leptothoe sp. PORK10 BA2]